MYYRAIHRVTMSSVDASSLSLPGRQGEMKGYIIDWSNRGNAMLQVLCGYLSHYSKGA